MMEDKRLIWRCQRGNREALRRIYEKYHVDLLKLAVVLTGEANTAQDIVYDVFVSFAESVPRISSAGSLKGPVFLLYGREIRKKTCNASSEMPSLCAG
jgi:DNA-directed RNA polymerase specialized sigma24 family protein